MIKKLSYDLHAYYVTFDGYFFYKTPHVMIRYWQKIIFIIIIIIILNNLKELLSPWTLNLFFFIKLE